MYAVVVEWWSVGETGADELDKQLTVEENHDCSSQHETLLQNKLMIVVCSLYWMSWRKTIEMWWWWWKKTIEMWWWWKKTEMWRRWWWWRKTIMEMWWLRWWKKTIKMWWWWCWWRKNNRNVVVVVVVVNLCKCATFHLFLSLHSASEELTWVGSVRFAKNRLVERIACKDMWYLNTAILVSPHSKQFQCLQKNVRGFASSILSPAWLPEWPGPEKRPGFYLYYSKLQRQFAFPRREPFGVIHNVSLRIQMLVAMPHIEFVKGIPTTLEQDSYFEVNKPNLIVFDGQMIDASKD